ncbi:MAG: hypothetical protein ABIH41_07360 [Nanoarchaeota archaeon]
MGSEYTPLRDRGELTAVIHDAQGAVSLDIIITSDEAGVVHHAWRGKPDHNTYLAQSPQEITSIGIASMISLYYNTRRKPQGSFMVQRPDVPIDADEVMRKYAPEVDRCLRRVREIMAD